MTRIQTCPACPSDQWDDKDLKQLQADLLPIEEPDWNDQALFGP